MNDTEAKARLADMLVRCGIERGVLGRIDADNVARILLPVVRKIADQRAAEELEAAIAKVQAVYDLQCPVMPSDHYVGAGAHIAHAWWEKVLGGRLSDLRARAAALRGEAGR